ncbi:MAG: dihydrofolate reductase [Marivirga sp.]|nr:dihydrofolate reductase [Marivirga sp.]
MRKIILNLAVSLDGYIAGPNGEYDWCLTDADYGMTDFLSSVDATLMGGKSYRLLLEYGPPYPEFINYVFTRTEKSSPYTNVELLSNDIPSFVTKLKKKDGKNIWLFGGAEIIHILRTHDLIDELILSVHPVLLGDGLSLFKKLKARKQFKLVDSITYPSGLVQITYKK